MATASMPLALPCVTFSEACTRSNVALASRRRPRRSASASTAARAQAALEPSPRPCGIEQSMSTCARGPSAMPAQSLNSATRRSSPLDDDAIRDVDPGPDSSKVTWSAPPLPGRGVALATTGSWGTGTASAGAPYTTACSPSRIALPWARPTPERRSPGPGPPPGTVRSPAVRWGVAAISGPAASPWSPWRRAVLWRDRRRRSPPAPRWPGRHGAGSPVRCAARRRRR